MALAEPKLLWRHQNCFGSMQTLSKIKLRKIQTTQATNSLLLKTLMKQLLRTLGPSLGGKEEMSGSSSN